MSYKRALRYVAVGLSLAYAVPVACGSGGVVGGECKEGSPPDCLGAGESTGGNANTGGKASLGGTVNTSGNRPGEAGNGTAATSQAGDGELTDGGIFDSPLDGQGDGGPPLECLPPHDAPSHCGDCDTQCQDPTPLCAPDGNGSFQCVPVCDPPLIECQGQCVDPDSFKSDPDNCGSCGHECPSDICQDGMCVGARFGHIALLCMDFGASASDSGPATLLGNAIFVPTANPVHVMSYTRGASVAAINRTNNLIGVAAGVRMRQAQITDAKTVEAVTKNLNINDYQVLLIHDLDQAQPGDPAAAATAWASASVLSSFARAGGVIVVLDGGDGTGEMNQLINAGNLLDSAGALSINGQTDITSQQVWNNAPFDVVGVNVLSPFLGNSHTCTFDTDATPSASTIFVLTDDEAGGLPIAIHRVIAP
jgi:hypothetical protein